MNILVIDNYDSFTYNLVQYLEEALGKRPDVIRNDKIEAHEVAKYDALVLSPGPGIPEEAGNLLAIIRAAKQPILGICLGHQAIAEVFGGSLRQLQKVYHGVATAVRHQGHALFANIPQDFEAGRYHSWVVTPESLPMDLQVLAADEGGQIMALAHQNRPIYGLQFHPESVLTPFGKTFIHNFLELANQYYHEKYTQATAQ